jgi:hypothetical protein
VSDLELVLDTNAEVIDNLFGGYHRIISYISEGLATDEGLEIARIIKDVLTKHEQLLRELS